MILKFHSDFFKDISSLLNADNYNVIIKVGEKENIKEFYAHSNILRAHSQHFKYIISNDIIKKCNILTINKPNITPTVFEIILKYFYTGKFNIENQSGENNFDLLIACDDLFLEELVKYVQYYLIDKQESWIQQNFVLILNIIFNLPNFKKLQDYCISFICRNPLILFNSKDYGYLKNTLSIFIPLIKFINIASDDFYDNVRPYEAIIPIDIYDDIMKYYLVKQPLS
ncbi:hypothetical protein C1646_751986 [Rhizophagus diaphanus]|nr:hypothetical protein C1646_751986 [Rhizophagus diaphanus] [Rhizophagus sp. MUCL 43196]